MKLEIMGAFLAYKSRNEMKAKGKGNTIVSLVSELLFEGSTPSSFIVSWVGCPEAVDLPARKFRERPSETVGCLVLGIFSAGVWWVESSFRCLRPFPLYSCLVEPWERP